MFTLIEMIAVIRSLITFMERRRRAAPNLHRDFADLQPCGDLFIQQPGHYQINDITLALGEAGMAAQQLLKAVWGPSHATDTPYLRVFMGGACVKKSRQTLPCRDTSSPKRGLGIASYLEPVFTGVKLLNTRFH